MDLVMDAVGVVNANAVHSGGRMRRRSNDPWCIMMLGLGLIKGGVGWIRMEGSGCGLEEGRVGRVHELKCR